MRIKPNTHVTATVDAELAIRLGVVRARELAALAAPVALGLRLCVVPARLRAVVLRVEAHDLFPMTERRARRAAYSLISRGLVSAHERQGVSL